MAEGASLPSRLAPELQTLRGDALILWSDSAARRQAFEAIVTALDSSDRDLAAAAARVDAAVVAGLQALGLPRGPVRRVLVQGGLGPYGRKDSDCTLVLYGDRMWGLIAEQQGPDSVFRTWVHESIHARRPFADEHRGEYLSWRGYEEGMTEGLARWAVQDGAGMRSIEGSYQYYVVAYRSLATILHIDPERLWRRLWIERVGEVRRAFVRAVDGLLRDSTGPILAQTQRLRLRGVADRLFDSARRNWVPDERAIMATWRTVFR